MAIEYRLADARDDRELRALLRQQALPGWVALSFEREPDFFALHASDTAEHSAVVAHDGATFIGCFSRAVRAVHLAGQRQRLGYLGELRLAPGCRRRIAALRGGYQHWRTRLRGAAELPYDLTAILADNRRARRLLEAGVAGLPTYTAIAEVTTLAFATGAGGGAGATVVEPAQLERYAAFIDERMREQPLAPCVGVADLRCVQRDGGVVLGLEAGGTILGCVAVWDRSGVRQTVVRGYAPTLGAARPLLNLAGAALGLPRLPPPGTRLRTAYLSWLCLAPGADRALLERLLRAAREHAARRGIEVLIAAWAEGAEALTWTRAATRAREYRSTLYLVHDELPAAALPAFGGRAPHVEAAFL